MMSTTYGISRQTQRSCLVPDLRNTQAAYGPSKASIPENVMRERVTRAVSHRNQNGRTFLSFGSNKLLVTVVILLIYCIGFSSAAATPRPTSVSVEAIDYEIYEAYLSRLAKLAETGTILADLSTPPLPVAAEIEAIQGDLRRRATGTTASLHSSITIDTSVPSKTPTPKVTNSTTTAASATTTLAPSPIPSPYDGNIGTNFTVQTCPDFINSFLVNPTFKSCLPFSLLLQVCTPVPVDWSRLTTLRTPIPSSKRPNPSSASPKPLTIPVLRTSPRAPHTSRLSPPTSPPHPTA